VPTVGSRRSANQSFPFDFDDSQSSASHSSTTAQRE
jgi:hypothetical protein